MAVMHRSIIQKTEQDPGAAQRAAAQATAQGIKTSGDVVGNAITYAGTRLAMLA